MVEQTLCERGICEVANLSDDTEHIGKFGRTSLCNDILKLMMIDDPSLCFEDCPVAVIAAFMGVSSAERSGEL